MLAFGIPAPLRGGGKAAQASGFCYLQAEVSALRLSLFPKFVPVFNIGQTCLRNKAEYVRDRTKSQLNYRVAAGCDRRPAGLRHHSTTYNRESTFFDHPDL